jgi:enolase
MTMHFIEIIYFKDSAILKDGVERPAEEGDKITRHLVSDDESMLNLEIAVEEAGLETQVCCIDHAIFSTIKELYKKMKQRESEGDDTKSKHEYYEAVGRIMAQYEPLL